MRYSNCPVFCLEGVETIPAMRQSQIRELFDAALDQPPEIRAQFLHRACHGDQQLESAVAKLLAARERPGGILDTPVQRRAEQQAQAPEIGSQIGPYKLLRELGAGGMGMVYQVVRADGVFDRVSALKVIRPEYAGPHLIESFRRERSILALLDHVHVARIVDGGSTSNGLPYFVADYVDGLPIDRFCSQHSLTVRQRMAIFQQVCDATNYLHQHNVIHCDLKPSNILVTAEGVVKLVDFGIASIWVDGANGGPAAPAVRLMTPAYASPEQCRREKLTPASDIYSLGVVLYELLTGTRPAGASGPGQLPSGEAPVVGPPSTAVSRSGNNRELASELRGDLDAIVLRATRPEPADRYRTAAEFGADIANYISGRAVAARYGGLPYRAAVALRRNLRPILIVLAILGLLGVNVWQGLEMRRRARYAQDIVEKLKKELDDAQTRQSQELRKQQSDFTGRNGDIPSIPTVPVQDLVSLDNAYRGSFSEAIRVWPGMTPERRYLIDGAERYLRQAEPLIAGHPEARPLLADAWLTLANLQGNPATPNLGDRPGARDSLREASRLAATSNDGGGSRLMDRLKDLRNRVGAN
jgi:hypothetical protein